MHDITAVTCAKLQNVGFLLTYFYMLASLARALTTFWRSTITALPVICASFCHQSSFPPSLDQNFVAWCQNHFLSFCESFVVTSLIIFLQFANKQTKHPDSLTDFGAIWVFYLVTYLLTYMRPKRIYHRLLPQQDNKHVKVQSQTESWKSTVVKWWKRS